MPNPSSPESRTQVVAELRAEAERLASQDTRPTEAQLTAYFRIAERLPRPNFGSSFAAEREANTPQYQEIVRKRKLLVYQVKLRLGTA